MFIYYTKEGKLTCIYYGDISFSKLHRLDGPAVEWFDGSKEWWINGKRHRLDGPAIEYSNGSKEWWVNGKQHRLGGPAVIFADGSEEWWVNDKLYRLDGPAIIWSNGDEEWYINGRKLNTKEVEKWINENNINLKTKQHQALFMLRFG